MGRALSWLEDTDEGRLVLESAAPAAAAAASDSRVLGTIEHNFDTLELSLKLGYDCALQQFLQPSQSCQYIGDTVE